MITSFVITLSKNPPDYASWIDIPNYLNDVVIKFIINNRGTHNEKLLLR